MARVSTQPVTIAASGTAPVPLPTGGGLGLAGVVLANLSTFLVQVSIGIDTFWLSPFTEDFFQLADTRQPPICTAFQLPGDTQTSGMIAPTWYGSGELLDTARYPAPLTSPAAIAAETAAAILQTGVPNVSLYKILFEGLLNNPSGNSVPNVSNYAAVNITIHGGASSGNMVATYQFVDSTSGFVVDAGILSADCTAANPGWPSYDLPVKADTLLLFNANGGGLNPVQAIAIGTNTPAPKRLASDFYHHRNFQGTVPASSPNGTTVQLLGTDSTANSDIPQLNLSNYNGLVTLFVNTTQALTAGIQVGMRDAAGNLNRQPMFGNSLTVAVQSLQVGHPYAFCSWWVQLASAGPASSTVVSLTLVPANPSP